VRLIYCSEWDISPLSACHDLYLIPVTVLFSPDSSILLTSFISSTHFGCYLESNYRLNLIYICHILCRFSYLFGRFQYYSLISWFSSCVNWPYITWTVCSHVFSGCYLQVLPVLLIIVIFVSFALFHLNFGFSCCSFWLCWFVHIVDLWPYQVTGGVYIYPLHWFVYMVMQIWLLVWIWLGDLNADLTCWPQLWPYILTFVLTE